MLDIISIGRITYPSTGPRPGARPVATTAGNRSRRNLGAMTDSDCAQNSAGGRPRRPQTDPTPGWWFSVVEVDLVNPAAHIPYQSFWRGSACLSRRCRSQCGSTSPGSEKPRQSRSTAKTEAAVCGQDRIAERCVLRERVLP